MTFDEFPESPNATDVNPDQFDPQSERPLDGGTGSRMNPRAKTFTDKAP
jgi:hypothetical protein